MALCHPSSVVIDDRNVPIKLDLVPVDDHVFWLAGLQFQGLESPAGDFRDGFAGGPGDGTVQVIL